MRGSPSSGGGGVRAAVAVAASRQQASEQWQAPPAPAVAADFARRRLIRDVFDVLDSEGTGYLDSRSMHPFAVQTGFDGTEADWWLEFEGLCGDWGADPDIGIGFELFETLVEDRSDMGCHSSDEELRKVLSVARSAAAMQDGKQIAEETASIRKGRGDELQRHRPADKASALHAEGQREAVGPEVQFDSDLGGSEEEFHTGSEEEVLRGMEAARMEAKTAEASPPLDPKEERRRKAIQAAAKLQAQEDEEQRKLDEIAARRKARLQQREKEKEAKRQHRVNQRRLVEDAEARRREAENVVKRQLGEQYRKEVEARKAAAAKCRASKLNAKSDWRAKQAARRAAEEEARLRAFDEEVIRIERLAKEVEEEEMRQREAARKKRQEFLRQREEEAAKRRAEEQAKLDEEAKLRELESGQVLEDVLDVTIARPEHALEDVPTEPPESPRVGLSDAEGEEEHNEEEEEEAVKKIFLSVYFAVTGERIAELRLRPETTIREMAGVVAIASERSRRAAFPILPKLLVDEDVLNNDETLDEAGLYDGATIVADMYAAVVTASTDHTAKVWNADLGICEKTLQGHGDVVHHACFGPDGRFIATASEDHTAILWMSVTGQVWRPLVGHADAVYAVAFSSDGKQVATASGDRTARIWNVKTGTCMHVLEGHSAPVFSVSFTLDCKSLITGSRDCTLKEWNSKTGVLDRTMPKAQDPVYSSSFSPCGLYTVTAQGEWTAKIMHTDTGEMRMILEGHNGIVVAASYGPAPCAIINWNARPGQKPTNAMEVGGRPVLVGLPGAKKRFQASLRRQATGALDGTTTSLAKAKSIGLDSTTNTLLKTKSAGFGSTANTLMNTKTIGLGSTTGSLVKAN